MCVIVVKPNGQELPKKDILKNCFENNPNGVGYAVKRINQDYITIKKGFFDFDKFYLALTQENITKDDIAILHFRVATAGLIDAGNCHPFVVTSQIGILRQTEIKTNKLTVAHNGIISGLSDDKKLSDTQLFIKNILASGEVYRNLYKSTAIQRLIEGYIGESKLAFLHSQQGLLLIGNFEEYKGCLFSNDTYKRQYWKLWGFNNKDCKDYEVCDGCGSQARKVKFVRQWDAFLCKPCRRKMSQGTWLERLDRYNF